MATELKNLSEFSIEELPDGSSFNIGLVVAEWNAQITGPMMDGAIQTLEKAGVKKKHIATHFVPGTFELPLAAQWFAQKAKIDAVICIGCVIQGETRHFDFICDSVANGIMNVSLKFGKPIIFGVLTTNNLQQALDRSGGKHGNKGVEAAVTALKMLDLQH